MANNEVIYKRPKKLMKLLEQLGIKSHETIDWYYYGYGFPQCGGKCKVSELPKQVKFAKCYKSVGLTFFVDGAL